MSIAKNSYWRSRKGLHFEEQTLQYLERQGLRLQQRNFRCVMGEIDLIMWQGERLVFVEVRYRASDSYGGAVATITYSKRQKLLRAARYYLLCHQQYQHCDCRFDVVAVQPGPQFNWIQNAFC